MSATCPAAGRVGVLRLCRAVDDIADDPGRSSEEKRELLELWKTCLNRERDLPEAL